MMILAIRRSARVEREGRLMPLSLEPLNTGAFTFVPPVPERGTLTGFSTAGLLLFQPDPLGKSCRECASPLSRWAIPFRPSAVLSLEPVARGQARARQPANSFKQSPSTEPHIGGRGAPETDLIPAGIEPTAPAVIGRSPSGELTGNPQNNKSDARGAATVIREHQCWAYRMTAARQIRQLMRG